jgi:integrase
MRGLPPIMAGVIYGGGLRVSECCELRVKDIDFDQSLVFVRSGKGNKDRSTLRDASAAQWRGHPTDPGVPRPRPRRDDDDLCPRRQGTAEPRAEPAGHATRAYGPVNRTGRADGVEIRSSPSAVVGPLPAHGHLGDG